MIVDSCVMSPCFTAGTPIGLKKLLNVNGPLQLGGSSIASFADLADKLNWTKTPTNIGFAGCIRNLTLNEVKTYDLEPTFALNANPYCKSIVGSASVHFGINSNFLVALLVCIALLLSK